MPRRRVYSIGEVADITGLPSSTLRYYESIGLIPAPERDLSSGHRRYTETDLDLLTWVSCLATTGMPVEDMRTYLANGPGDAAHQVALLAGLDARLALEEQHVALRRRYVQLKIAYWQAIEANDDEQVATLAAQASRFASELRNPPEQEQK